MFPEIYSMTDRMFCHFELFFAHLSIQQLKKSKFWKNEKKTWNISSFYNSAPKIMITCYAVPEIWCMTDVITFHFGPFLALFPANSPKNQNLKKMKKILEVSLFYNSVPKIMIICYAVREIWHVTDVTVIFYFGLFFVLLQPKKTKF